MAAAKDKDNYSERAAKGQAYNLAVMTAIAECKQNDNKFILQQYFRHKEFMSMIQGLDDAALVKAVENEDLIAALEALKKAVS